MRSESNMTLTDILPSTYLAVFYDLEENGLPNMSPAFEQRKRLTVEAGGESYLKYNVSQLSISILYVQA